MGEVIDITANNRNPLTEVHPLARHNDWVKDQLFTLSERVQVDQDHQDFVHGEARLRDKLNTIVDPSIYGR